MVRSARKTEEPRAGGAVVRNGENAVAENAPGKDGRELLYENEFWRFSLSVYSPDEVAQECLSLQEALGLDVNILLFCAWLGTRSIVLRREAIEAACQVIARWHDNIVRPLRRVRQHLKTQGDPFASLRTRVKAFELEAEQIEQAMLFAYARDILEPSESVRSDDVIAQNVSEYIAMKAASMSSPHQFAAPVLIRTAQRIT